MSADPRRILVVRAGALGDTLMATPVVPALAARHPGAAIDFLASAAAAPLVEGHPGVRRVYRLRWRNLPYALSIEQRRLVRAWRREPYDLAVVLEHAPQYRALVERAGARRVIGFHVTPFDPARHSVANNLRAAGVDDAEAPPAPELHLSDGDLAVADAILGAADGPLAGLHAGYGPSRWRSKRRQQTRLRGWPPERFAAVGRALAAHGYRIVLTGSAADRPLVQRIAALLPSGAAIDLAGRTRPRELAAVVAAGDAAELPRSTRSAPARPPAGAVARPAADGPVAGGLGRRRLAAAALGPPPAFPLQRPLQLRPSPVELVDAPEVLDLHRRIGAIDDEVVALAPRVAHLAADPSVAAPEEVEHSRETIGPRGAAL